MEADFIWGAGSVIRIESAGKLNIARGATLDNDGTVDNDGIIDIYGTVTHPDKLTGTVNDYTGASADVNSVVQAIENYGLIAKAEEKTITVTGNADKSASDVLRLGDITGLVIDWKAELTVTGGRRPSKGIGMINFNNGEFKLTGGAIQLPASANGWVDGIYANGAATVTVDGGKVTGNRAEDNGISVEDGELIINSGEINIPRGNMLFAKKLTVNDPSVMTGIAFKGDTTSYVAAIYGHAATVLDSEVFPAENEGGDDRPESISYVVEDGATWDIEGVTSDMTAFRMIGNMTVKTGGTLNLKKTTLKSDGTLIIEPGAEVNLDQDSLLRFKRIIVGTPSNSTGSMSVAMSDPDKGVLNNSGALSIPAGGTLTNEGIINNKSTGAIVNDGTFTNNGEFNAEPGSRVEGNGERNGANADDVKSGDSTSSGSGGCNTGLGLFGLSLAGIAARKCRKV
jgi:hypothetical protein